MVPRAMGWLGGAMFLASLAFCGWTYLTAWSITSSAVNWSAVAVNSALVLIFAAHHSLFARDRAKAWLARVVPDALLRSVYVWIASTLLIVMVWMWQPIGGEIYRLRGSLALVGGVVQLTGVCLIVLAVRAIDALELAGIRQIRSVPALPAPPALVVRGPYALVRHPLYLGWILLAFGTPHLTGDRFAFAILTTVYVLAAVPWEERSLSATFGAAYARYSKSVPWRVVPYIY